MLHNSHRPSHSFRLFSIFRSESQNISDEHGLNLTCVWRWWEVLAIQASNRKAWYMDQKIYSPMKMRFGSCTIPEPSCTNKGIPIADHGGSENVGDGTAVEHRYNISWPALQVVVSIGCSWDHYPSTSGAKWYNTGASSSIPTFTCASGSTALKLPFTGRTDAGEPLKNTITIPPL
jgi:hypothetical protein